MIEYHGEKYKIVVVIPAGREKYLSIFKNFLYRKLDEGVLDAIQLWQNTVDANDLAYLTSMELENPKVKIYRLGEPITPTWETYNALQTHKFFVNAHDDDTIYIRFDDDIVWCADDTIEKICKARIDHPKAFLIVPNTINSTLFNSWHQENGALSEEAGRVRRYTKSDPDYAYLDAFNYTDGKFCDLIHSTFKKHYLENTLSAYYLPSKVLKEYQRFSICCIAWWGKDKLRPGEVEEPQLAYQIPEALKRPNYFVGDALLVHGAYHSQRKYLEATGDVALKWYATITK